MDLEERNSLSGECNYDSVAVFDGDSQTDTLLGRWCGREQPASLVSKGSKLLVVLSTDRNEARRGFTASYLGGKCSPHSGDYQLSKQLNIRLSLKVRDILFSEGFRIYT